LSKTLENLTNNKSGCLSIIEYRSRYTNVYSDSTTTDNNWAGKFIERLMRCSLLRIH